MSDRSGSAGVAPGGRLALRPEQAFLLRGRNREALEARVVDWLARFFPARARPLGADALARLARHAVARAAAHRLAEPHDVCRFAGLELVLGRDFDLEPWIDEALDPEAGGTPSERLAAVHDRALGGTAGS